MSLSNLKQIIYTAIFWLVAGVASSAEYTPIPIDSVDYEKIQHKKVRRLVRDQHQLGIHFFNDLHPSCAVIADSNTYGIHIKSQLIRQDIEKVWNIVSKQSVKDEFNGRIVSFGFLYARGSNKLSYINDDCKGLEVGQIVFFNLRLLRGFMNLAVALEVTRVDSGNKTIEYCYLSNGKTEGTQQVSLKPTPEGYTVITQFTRYKCKSKLRDKRFYAFFHGRIVRELLGNLKRKSEISL